MPTPLSLNNRHDKELMISFRSVTIKTTQKMRQKRGKIRTLLMKRLKSSQLFSSAVQSDPFSINTHASTKPT